MSLSERQFLILRGKIKAAEQRWRGRAEQERLHGTDDLRSEAEDSAAAFEAIGLLIEILMPKDKTE